MVEIGVEAPKQAQAVPEYTPTDMIELNKDFFQPSATYSTFSKAVQKDMTLGHLSEKDIRNIELRLGNIDDCTLLIAKNAQRWGFLQHTVNHYMAWIANRVTVGRGRDGFTAKLMRSTFTEHKQTMRDLEGAERRNEGLRGKITKYTGI